MTLRFLLASCTMLCLASVPLQIQAQFDDAARQSYDQFRAKARKDYDDFRAKANAAYAEHMKKAWASFRAEQPVPKPHEEKRPPQTFPDDEQERLSIESRPVPIDSITPAPSPKPRPRPLSPIQVTPIEQQPGVEFTWCGTACTVRRPQHALAPLASCDNATLSAAWKTLSSTDLDNTLADCLNIRSERDMNDWAYLNMLHALTETWLGKGNTATFVAAYLYCQSGYQMRLARHGQDLCMLFGSPYVIYGKAFYIIGGTNYYAYGLDAKAQVEVCNVEFPQEQPMCLALPRLPRLNDSEAPQRTLTSSRYPQMKVEVSVNQNLLDFFDSYPNSYTDNNFMTRWALYANTPLDPAVAEKLYPALQALIGGKTQREAADMLLNWVQTALTYGYDDQVWGYDRAFFAEESLHYPFCDCEDRSILFTRLIRDLLHLKALLVYYPGHLATAIAFTDNVPGDYVELRGTRYVVCDPTYINAPVGHTMPDMDNATAQVILLE